MDTNIVIVLVVSVIAIIAAVLITAKVTTTRLKKNAEGTIEMCIRDRGKVMACREKYQLPPTKQDRVMEKNAKLLAE